MSEVARLKRLLRREIAAQQQLLVGKVISEMRIVDFDGSGAGVFVADVEIGANNFLQGLPVKYNNGGRNYASLGQTVALKRNAQGRYEIIGPGDRLSTPVEEVAYDLTTQAGGAGVSTGFGSERVAYSFYATLDGTAPLGVLWADGVTPYNLVRIVDAQGNPV